MIIRKIKLDKYNVIVGYNDGKYCLAPVGHKGAIVSGKRLKPTADLFIKMMRLARVVKILNGLNHA